MNDQKLESTLNAIHDTLGTLDHRMGSLEQGQEAMRSDIQALQQRQ